MPPCILPEGLPRLPLLSVLAGCHFPNRNYYGGMRRKKDSGIVSSSFFYTFVSEPCGLFRLGRQI